MAKKFLQYKLPENIEIIGKGACWLSVLNINWIQLVPLQSFASFPHSMDRAFTLVDGAWTSLQALYMAGKESKKNNRNDHQSLTELPRWGLLTITPWMLLTISKGLSNVVLHFCYAGSVYLCGVHELALVGAARELTEEVHQVEGASRTPVHTCSDCKKNFQWKTITRFANVTCFTNNIVSGG